MGFTTRLKVTLSPFFRRFPAKDPELAERINRRIAVNRTDGYIYFRIPKAANSTVIRNLSNIESDAAFDVSAAKHGFIRPSQLWWWETRNLERRFYLFTVVRDPYSRVVSAYLDKVERSKRQSKVRSRLGLGADEPISFEQFCTYLEAGGLNDDAHWARQVDLIPCDPSLLHAIARVESLNADLPPILHRATGKPVSEFQTHSPHRTGAAERMHKVYNRQTASRVRDLYMADFKAFGYDPNPPWLKALA